MALRLLLVTLGGLALIGCVPTPLGRATPTLGSNDAGSTVSPAPTVAPSKAGPTGSPSFVRPTPRPSPTFLAYEVRAGDTLTSIARQFGTTARSIAYWNRSRYPSLDPDAPTYQPGLIKVGWFLLLIPTAVVDEDELPELTPEPSPLA
jgi:hypothetical protein